MLLSTTPRTPIHVFLLTPCILLSISYLYALLTRPPIPLYAQIDNPGEWGWPSWYGRRGVIPGFAMTGAGKDEVCNERKDVLFFIGTSVLLCDILWLTAGCGV